MNKKDMLVRISEISGVERKEAEKVLDAFIGVFTDALRNGEKLHIVGIGTFESHQRCAYNCYNPTTGEVKEIPTQNTIQFRASSKLKNSVNS